MVPGDRHARFCHKLTSSSTWPPKSLQALIAWVLGFLNNQTRAAVKQASIGGSAWSTWRVIAIRGVADNRVHFLEFKGRGSIGGVRGENWIERLPIHFGGWLPRNCQVGGAGKDLRLRP